MKKQENTIKEQKLCVDCKFLEVDQTRRNICNRPISTTISAVTGKPVTIYANATAEYERINANGCGVSAKYFELKMKHKLSLQSLLNLHGDTMQTISKIVKTCVIAGFILTLFIFFGYEVQQYIDQNNNKSDARPSVDGSLRG